MSLNKFMHPRNRYRKPPDFKALAIKYPEFRKYAKQDVSGKIRLDFKDLESVRALTCTLLKEDFDLDVEIPLTRLIPTLPLRLNYLLWIEDMLGNNRKPSEFIKGIDIGCGASCVYPLLAAKQFRWHMLATEVDTDSAFVASNNVRKNKLQNMISVRTVNEGVMLEGALEPNTEYDFCMCNPPFFSSMEELDLQKVSRTPSRNPPRNAHSGSPGELVVTGGETAFVGRIIKDSVKVKTAVRIYTVMLGHKTSVGKVKQLLQDEGIARVATTEFCQGRTTRWGVAWSLDPALVLTEVKDAPVSVKKKTPFTHTFELDLATTIARLRNLMDQLQMTSSTLKNNNEVCAMDVAVMSNTWANSRKKRRQEKLKSLPSKDVNSEESNSSTSGNTDLCRVKSENESNIPDIATSDKILNNNEEFKSEKNLVPNFEENMDFKPTDGLYNDNSGFKTEKKRPLSEEASCSDLNPPKKIKLENCSSVSNPNPSKEPFLQGSLIVKKSAQGSVVELCWLRGAGGRDAAHQVLQYFKNNLMTH